MKGDTKTEINLGRGKMVRAFFRTRENDDDNSL